MNRFCVSIFALFLALVSVSVLFIALENTDKYASADINPEFCIIIDAGHGGEDGGTSSADGTLEKAINLNVAQYLDHMLRTAGYKTIMTRNSDEQLGDTSLSTIRQRKVSDIKERLRITEINSNSILVSIHQNHYSSPLYSGTQVFYSPNSEYSKILADSIQNTVVKQLQPNNNRSVKQVGTNIYLLYNCKLPAVMVECGFMSNIEEAEKLKQKNYQKQIAYSIMCGIQNYLEDRDG
ncbi:MAG: N-acetylmuramoyl-L-alanine amidase [Clostridia bacterium]|nr:N-acetylmuramoyl-L-alanine amidase [Clostridia bacterium]